MSEIFTRQFKEAVLSLLVQDKAFLREACPVLKPEYLDENIYCIAVESIIKTYGDSGGLVSKAGLLNDIVNGLIKLNKVKDKEQESKLAIKPASDFIEKIFKPFDGPLSDVKLKFLEYCRTREMQLTMGELYGKLETGEVDCNSVMNSIRQAYTRINRQSSPGIDFFGSLDDFDFVKNKGKTFTSGFPALDRKMDGGLTEGTLTTYIARPKGGKSMTLVNVGYANLMRGKTVVEFSLEISEEKIRRRYMSRISRVPLGQLAEQEVEVKRRCMEFFKRFKGRLFIKEYPTGTATVDVLRSYLYWLDSSSGIKPDVVLVDYGDILKSLDRHQEERHNQRACYEQLRALSSEFKCAVVTASQCNREGSDKEIVKMTDVAEAYAKCAISDHIITICQTDAEEIENRARLFFAGSREAETGSQVKVRLDWKTCIIVEAHDQDAPGQEGGAAYDSSKERDDEF